MKISLALLLLMVGAISPVCAETLRSTTTLQVMDDSDDVRQYRVFTGVTGRVDAQGQHRLGAGIGYHRLSDVDGRHIFRQARFDYQYQPTPATALEGSVGMLRGEDWSPLEGHLQLRHNFAAPVYMELFAERTYVDTVAAIENEIDLRSVGVSLDFGPYAGWTVVGAHTRQRMGDGNNRGISVGRLIYETAHPSLLLEGRSRFVRSDFDGAEYFSPEKLDEHLVSVVWRQPVHGDRWYVSARAGGGQQRVNSEDSEAVFVAELQWRGWFDHHWGLEAEAMCRNTGDLNARAADGDYRFCMATVSLLRSW